MTKFEKEESEKILRYRIDVPEQGVAFEFKNLEELKSFLENELDFWSSNANTFQSISFEGSNISINLSSQYMKYWEGVLSDLDNQEQERQRATFLRKVSSEISNHGWLISVGSVMQDILSQQDGILDTTLLIVLYSRGAEFPKINGLHNRLSQLRSILFHAPFGKTVKNAISAESIVESASSRLAESREFLSETEVFYKEKKIELEELTAAYKEKIALDAPASYWETIERNAKRSKWTLLGVFVSAITLPFVMVLCNWQSVISFWSGLFSANAGNVVLSNIVFVSVPILAYGWILKHVSRLLLKAIEVETDASFRVMYAKTYLSLMKHSGELDEHDRAIVLNALFRPLTSGGSDDGPPIGVVDLLKNRAGGGAG